jgi:hypothetical protein
VVATSELAILISAKDGYSKQLDGLASNLGNVGKATGAPVKALGSLGGAIGDVAKLGAGLAIGGGIAAVAGGFVAAGKAAADFEGVMSGVKAVSGATQGEMDGLSKLALQLGKDTSFSASEAAAGMEELVKGGLSIPDIMNGAAQATLDLAAAGGVSLPEAATIAANALAQFNLKGEDMAHVADLIAGAANASALDVSDFQQSLQSAGAVAATVGFKFDDLAQGIAIMGKAGITGSDAGTSLKTMMLNLSPATDKAAGVMQDLGIMTFNSTEAMQRLTKAGIAPAAAGSDALYIQTLKLTLGMKQSEAVTAKNYKEFAKMSQEVGLTSNAFFDATGKVKSMAEVAEILQKSTANLTQEQKLSTLQTLFGTDAVRAAAVLAKEGAKGFNEMATSMGKVSAKAVGLEKLNNAAGDFQALQGSLETAAITLGVAFLPALRAVTQAATAAVNAAIPFLEAMGPQLTAALGPVLAILPDLGTAISQAFAYFTTGTGDIEKFRGVLNKLIGKDGAQAVIVVFTNLADFFSGTVIPMFKSFGDIVSTVMKGDFGDALDAAAKHIGTFGPKLLATLAEWGKAFVAWVGPQIPPLLAELGKLLVALTEWVATEALPVIATKLVEWGMAFVQWVAPLIPPLLVELGRLYLEMQKWMITVALPAIISQLARWGAAFVGWVITDVLPKLPGELLKINKAVVDFLNQAAIDFLTEAGKTGAALFKGFMDELGKLAPVAWNAIAGDDAGSLKSRMYSGLKDAIEHAVAGVNKWIDDLIAPFRRAWETIKDIIDKIRRNKPEADAGAGPPTGGGGAPKISSIGMNGGVLRPASITIYNDIDARTQNPQLVAQAFGGTLAEAMQRQLVSGVR